jgi:cytidine deaminase
VSLEERAKHAQHQAHAPYSKFKVGAAVEMDGEVYEGCNVENASFPLSVCAERNAIAAAVVAGARHLTQVAVYTDASPPAAPCGGCRQVLREFAQDPARVKVVSINGAGERREWTVEQLLPDSFTGDELP